MNTPVSFEIAKVLKEKGFNIPQLYFYIDGDISWKVDNTRCRNQIEGEYAAPTITEVVMWLYEKHGIWITVTSISQESWQCHMCRKGDSLGKCYLEDFYTPTEAYESAIEYTLKNLI